MKLNKHCSLFHFFLGPLFDPGPLNRSPPLSLFRPPFTLYCGMGDDYFRTKILMRCYQFAENRKRR